MKQPPISQNKYLQPLDSPVDSSDIQPKYVPWEWGIRQGVQLKKIKSSTGYFKKLSAGAVGTITSITGGTIQTSTITSSTISLSSFQGTISQPVSTGGTFTNMTANVGTFNNSLYTGTLNNAAIGTPNVSGGTANFGAYQTGGTVGLGTVISYVKSVSPSTVLGTLTFNNGILILSQ